MQFFMLPAFSLGIIATLCLCIDSSLFFLCDHQWTYLLCSLFIAALFRSASLLNVTYIALLCTLESFLMYGNCFIPLYFIIPLMIAYGPIRRYLYNNPSLPMLAALLCFSIQNITVHDGASSQLFYTISKIIGTMTGVWFFSLTIDFIRQNRTIASEH